MKLVFTFEEDSLVTADRNMLTSILRNLIQNAVKYTHEGGTVTIGLEEEEGLPCIFVRDNGVGIEPENVDYIFRADLRFSTPGTNRESGSGLGLPLCKELVEKHGGRIRVISLPDKGSEFRFTLSVV